MSAPPIPPRDLLPVGAFEALCALADELARLSSYNAATNDSPASRYWIWKHQHSYDVLFDRARAWGWRHWSDR